MMQQFKDRMYALGQERQYLIRREDGTIEVVDIEKLGIAEEGSRINAAALNQFVAHVNDNSIHVSRAEFDALATRVKTVEDALINDFKNNIFKVSFANPVGVKINRGYWDPANAQLGIK
ncbi:hypothetical protein [Brevibacillus reuszeri]|uniref:hypothetical protein n=1 Tax=Brevibacillus reuszeri TaxID=54915 RepID=UPI000CCBDD7E|nr:hypothetical protein [Brevibacillus reuszeri]